MSALNTWNLALSTNWDGIDKYLICDISTWPLTTSPLLWTRQLSVFQIYFQLDLVKVPADLVSNLLTSLMPGIISILVAGMAAWEIFKDSVLSLLLIESK